MGEVLKGKCPTMKQRNIIKTGIENHQTILLINTSYYLQIQGITSVIKKISWDSWKKIYVFFIPNKNCWIAITWGKSVFLLYNIKTQGPTSNLVFLVIVISAMFNFQFCPKLHDKNSIQISSNFDHGGPNRPKIGFIWFY